MSYANIAAITQSGSLIQRLTAAAADEGKSLESPGTWIGARIWKFATAPGWAAKWGSALAAGIEDPGAEESVISDADILAVIQPMP